MDTYYSGMVRHCLKYYVKTIDEGRGGHPIFRTPAEKENWLACYQVLKDYSERDREIITYLYLPGDTIADKIYSLSKSMRIPQNSIWSLLADTERKIARKRGLI